MHDDRMYPYYLGGPPVQGGGYPRPYPLSGPYPVAGYAPVPPMPFPPAPHVPWPYPWPASPGSYPQAPQEKAASGFLGVGDGRFIKGVLVGAGITLLLTNESVQRAAIRSVVRVWTTVYGGFEEVKERFRDAEAELRAAEEQSGQP